MLVLLSLIHVWDIVSVLPLGRRVLNWMVGIFNHQICWANGMTLCVSRLDFIGWRSVLVRKSRLYVFIKRVLAGNVN